MGRAKGVDAVRTNTHLQELKHHQTSAHTLTIVAQDTHGLGQGPLGGGVGGEAAVVDGEGGLEGWVGQVLEELPHNN